MNPNSSDNAVKSYDIWVPANTKKINEANQSEVEAIMAQMFKPESAKYKPFQTMAVQALKAHPESNKPESTDKGNDELSQKQLDELKKYQDKALKFAKTEFEAMTEKMIHDNIGKIESAAKKKHIIEANMALEKTGFTLFQDMDGVIFVAKLFTKDDQVDLATVARIPDQAKIHKMGKNPLLDVGAAIQPKSDKAPSSELEEPSRRSASLANHSGLYPSACL